MVEATPHAAVLSLHVASRLIVLAGNQLVKSHSGVMLCCYCFLQCKINKIKARGMMDSFWAIVHDLCVKCVFVSLVSR